MSSYLLCLGLFILCNASQYVNAVDLEGSKVFNIYSTNVNELKVANNLEARLDGVDIWQHGQIDGTATRVLVPKAILPQFNDLLNSIPLNYELFMDNVEEVLTAQYHRSIEARKSIRQGRITFEAYHSHEEINAYLDKLAIDFPTRVKVDILGKSSEGRDVKVIKISSGGADKPVFLSDAGIHAREWLAPSTALYMIQELVENPANSELVNKMDWIIVPLLNPDGYEYSRQGPSNRLWRKTRSIFTSTICPGVDGNRNFDYKWLTVGASSNPCTDTYAGPKSRSEPEIQKFVDLMNEHKARIKVYLAIHSHGSFIIHPFGHDSSYPANVVELKNAAREMADAIDAVAIEGSKEYDVGTPFEVLGYYGSGASDDYAIGSAGIPLAFTLELPSGKEAFGFHMDEADIERVVKETWVGVVALAHKVSG